MGAILRKYATATAAGTHIRIPVIKAASQDFALSGDWTPAAGDVKISKDGGTQANIGTLPSFSNGSWTFQLTAAELTAKTVEIVIIDQDGPAIEDQMVLIETYGHVAALHFTENMAAGIVSGTAQTGTLTVTSATTDLAELTNDHYNGRTLIWLDGDLAGQVAEVTDYVGTNGQLTYSQLTEAPANGDRFILV